MLSLPILEFDDFILNQNLRRIQIISPLFQYNIYTIFGKLTYSPFKYTILIHSCCSSSNPHGRRHITCPFQLISNLGPLRSVWFEHCDLCSPVCIPPGQGPSLECTRDHKKLWNIYFLLVFSALIKTCPAILVWKSKKYHLKQKKH